MRKKIGTIIVRFVVLTLGALMAAVGLELFLIPNKLIDGGIVGISILASYLSNYPLGLFIVGLNIPFIILGHFRIGKTFTFSTIYAVSALAFFTTKFIPVPAFTEDLLLVTIFGGIMLGAGVGLILRSEGSLDGTEVIALLLSPRISISVGEIVMIINFFILGSSGFVFGWENAMYSLITYFVAFKTIDLVMGGIDESKSIMIMSEKSSEISEAIVHQLGKGVTHFYAKGGFSETDKEVLYCVVSRLELSKLKSIVHEYDPEAFMTIEVVQDVHGGRFNKRAILAEQSQNH
ncbi:MAG: YitT family protein [Syntrophomonadaceae bacterium]|nr:YitT family protein [Syntrophomonadaceae bacterium]